MSVIIPLNKVINFLAYVGRSLFNPLIQEKKFFHWSAFPEIPNVFYKALAPWNCWNVKLTLLVITKLLLN